MKLDIEKNRISLMTLFVLFLMTLGAIKIVEEIFFYLT